LVVLGELLRTTCLAFCVKASPAFRNFLVQGVVVRPALAIPYFTGFAVFIGNLISRAAAINDLQDTIINLTLEKFQTLLEPLIAKSMSQLDDIIGILEKFEAGIHLAEGSPFAGITRENRSLVQEKLQALRDSIASSDVRAVASSAAAIKDKGAAGLLAGRRASSARDSDALQREVREVGRLQLRKLKESEIVGLFSNLWSSIRCPPMALKQIYKLIFHPQRGARVIFPRYYLCSNLVFNYSRPLPVVHIHRHSDFFRRDRSLYCHCQCRTHNICRIR
jgi:hypothetical protein